MASSLSEKDAGRALNEKVAVTVFGADLTVPREYAMAIVGATYTDVTGRTFEVSVSGHRVSIPMPDADSLPGHESDLTINARYFRHVAQHLLAFPNEIEQRVERDIASVRKSVPPYSSDVATAFLVVEKLARLEPHPWMLALTNWNYYGDRSFVAQFASHALGPNRVEARADSAPLAICRAALRALVPDEGSESDQEGSR